MSAWKYRFAAGLAIGLFLALIPVSAPAALYADVIVYNGKILTLDSLDPNNFRTVQAAAIYRGEFVAGEGNTGGAQ